MTARLMDLPLLKSFVLVVDERSVTRVAEKLGRTQPAISLQLRRLEQLAGRQLFDGDLRAARLTAHGETLLRYARQILALHDEVQAQLAEPGLEGRVVLGCPDLYAGHVLPPILSGFRKTFPKVEVTVRCALSTRLAEEMSDGRIDVAIATEMPGVRPASGVRSRIGHEPLAWFGATKGGAWRERELPLAMLPEGNLYRNRALAALRRLKRPFRIACISESIAGLQAMAAGDNAVTVLSARVDIPGLRTLGRGEDLPPLPSVDLVLWHRSPGESQARDQLASHIRAEAR